MNKMLGMWWSLIMNTLREYDVSYVEILLMSAHFCKFTIKPNARRRVRFPLVLTLTYAEHVLPIKELLLMNTKV